MRICVRSEVSRRHGGVVAGWAAPATGSPRAKMRAENYGWATCQECGEKAQPLKLLFVLSLSVENLMKLKHAVGIFRI